MTQIEIREALMDRSRALAEQARGYVGASIALARESTEQLADALESLDAPVATLRDAGTRLTVLSQRFAAELLTAQASAVETALADSAARLRLAAKAEDLRSLLREQVDRLPASRERLSGDLRHAAAATTRAGRELRELATETYSDLLAGNTKPRAKRTARGQKRPARAKTARGTKRQSATAAKTGRKKQATARRKSGAKRKQSARKTG
ncbi:MAG TPA: phasin family protein [Steroidobacteraceae bacterium]|nr:phasin family protein [Steroidobacteraceae bacterium]